MAPTRGTKGMRSTEGRTSARKHPGTNSRASAKAGGAGSRTIGAKKNKKLLQSGGTPDLSHSF